MRCRSPRDELSSLQRELDAAYARWSELDG